MLGMTGKVVSGKLTSPLPLSSQDRGRQKFLQKDGSLPSQGRFRGVG